MSGAIILRLLWAAVYVKTNSAELADAAASAYAKRYGYQ